MSQFEKGQYVTWEGGGRTNRARIVDTYIEEITKTIGDQEYHMTPSIDAPAYLVEQDDGNEFIFPHSQLTFCGTQELPVESDSHVKMKEQNKANRV